MQRFATSDGVEIAYEVVGDGAPVVVCHGGPSTTHAYLVGDLADLQDRAQLVFHDYRGSGESAPAPIASYTFERLADDVDELRAFLGFEGITVLAHSMGGFVALQYALRHPEHCKQLVLISCSPAGTMKRSALPTLRALGPVRFGTMLGRAASYFGRWSRRPDSEAKTLARFSIMGVMQEGRPEWRSEVAKREILAENANAESLERVGFGTDLCAALHRIECPVLLLHGTNDAPFAAGAQLLERRLPQVAKIAFPGVGHHPLVEEHDAVISAIASVLDEGGDNAHG